MQPTNQLGYFGDHVSSNEQRVGVRGIVQLPREPQDVSGYRLGGSIDYTFPAARQLAGGGFIVVAKSHLIFKGAYGIAGVLGICRQSAACSGKVTIDYSSRRRVLLDVNYRTKPPWPIPADGAGHSLVLARPSYGENDPSAWAASDSVGGSPGNLDPIRP